FLMNRKMCPLASRSRQGRWSPLPPLDLPATLHGLSPTLQSLFPTMVSTLWRWREPHCQVLQSEAASRVRRTRSIEPVHSPAHPLSPEVFPEYREPSLQGCRSERYLVARAQF